MTVKSAIKQRFGLTISLVLFVFAVMMAAFLSSGLIVLILHVTGAMRFPLQARDDRDANPVGVLILLIGLCIVLGTTIAAFFSNRALKPIRRVIAATNRVAQGDFDARVDIRGIYELEELSGSFNKMVEELASIETLRSDFINDFSHEFKTSIASVRGFAKLLKDGDQSGLEKQEYLDIIISESERLATLSTNIMNLSKYESIGIVPDRTVFRLDEQIRRVVVLTEPKWSAKDMTVSVDLADMTFSGNEDLTQQIWLNLLDNAVKFSDRGGAIDIHLSRPGGLFTIRPDVSIFRSQMAIDADRPHLVNNPPDNGVLFTIHDDGIGMAETTRSRVFDKFYQADESHAKAGNGLGLAIVKRIVELCGGTVEVRSQLGEGSTFTVFLPS
jgi:signal transduction histidine kinase